MASQSTGEGLSPSTLDACPQPGLLRVFPTAQLRIGGSRDHPALAGSTDLLAPLTEVSEARSLVFVGINSHMKRDRGQIQNEGAFVVLELGAPLGGSFLIPHHRSSEIKCCPFWGGVLWKIHYLSIIDKANHWLWIQPPAPPPPWKSGGGAESSSPLTSGSVPTSSPAPTPQSLH